MSWNDYMRACGYREYPECVLECSTEEIKDWEGPSLFDYRIKIDGKPVTGFHPTEKQAWDEYARLTGMKDRP